MVRAGDWLGGLPHGAGGIGRAEQGGGAGAGLGQGAHTAGGGGPEGLWTKEIRTYVSTCAYVQCMYIHVHCTYSTHKRSVCNDSSYSVLL